MQRLSEVGSPVIRGNTHDALQSLCKGKIYVISPAGSIHEVAFGAGVGAKEGSPGGCKGNGHVVGGMPMFHAEACPGSVHEMYVLR